MHWVMENIREKHELAPGPSDLHDRMAWLMTGRGAEEELGAHMARLRGGVEQARAVQHSNGSRRGVEGLVRVLRARRDHRLVRDRHGDVRKGGSQIRGPR